MEAWLLNVENARPWATWLNAANVRNVDLSSCLDASNFRKAGVYLILIHNIRPDSIPGVETRFRKLDADVQSRVWMLMYSGSGYDSGRSDLAHVHFLRYPVPAGEGLSDAQKIAFRSAISLLQGGESSAEAVWASFYPPDNADIVALMILLRAPEVVDVKTAIEKFSKTDGSKRVYLQYFRAAGLAGAENPLLFKEWQHALASHDFPRISGAIEAALGGAPD